MIAKLKDTTANKNKNFPRVPQMSQSIPGILFSLHCLDFQAEDRFTARWHGGKPCGKASSKIGSIKERNGMDLTEAEDIRRDGKDTQKNCTKQIFMTKIIRMV